MILKLSKTPKNRPTNRIIVVESSLLPKVFVELSARVEYALLALLEMASRRPEKTPLKISEIVAEQAIPDRYLEHILASLRRAGVVQSLRGAKGGYVLMREPWQITLLEIVASVEGELLENGQKERSTPPTLEQTLVYEVWQQATAASKAVLSRYTLQDLCQQREAQRHTDPMYYI